MMKKIIHNLRQQPEEIRRHILHILIALAAFVLFFLWIYSLGSGLTETQTKISDDLKPLSALKDNIIGGYKSISEPDLNLPENN